MALQVVHKGTSNKCTPIVSAMAQSGELGALPFRGLGPARRRPPRACGPKTRTWVAEAMSRPGGPSALPTLTLSMWQQVRLVWIGAEKLAIAYGL